MPRKAIDYSRTIIYKIVSRDLNISKCYVGHTTDFPHRKRGHKTHCNNSKDKKHNIYVYSYIRENGGWDNWDMIEIEKFPCLDVNEAHKRERYYIELLKAELNKQLPTRTYKEYYEQNIEQIKEQHKEYRENNLEHLKEKRNEWREENKDKIKEQLITPHK